MNQTEPTTDDSNRMTDERARALREEALAWWSKDTGIPLDARMTTAERIDKGQSIRAFIAAAELRDATIKELRWELDNVKRHSNAVMAERDSRIAELGAESDNAKEDHDGARHYAEELERSVEHALADANTLRTEAARLREALVSAWTRMERARAILTKGDSSALCNWSMLDTTLDREALAATEPESEGTTAIEPEHGELDIDADVLIRLKKVLPPYCFERELIKEFEKAVGLLRRASGAPSDALGLVADVYEFLARMNGVGESGEEFYEGIKKLDKILEGANTKIEVSGEAAKQEWFEAWLEENENIINLLAMYQPQHVREHAVDLFRKLHADVRAQMNGGAGEE